MPNLNINAPRYSRISISKHPPPIQQIRFSSSSLLWENQERPWLEVPAVSWGNVNNWKTKSATFSYRGVKRPCCHNSGGMTSTKFLICTDHFIKYTRPISSEYSNTSLASAKKSIKTWELNTISRRIDTIDQHVPVKSRNKLKRQIFH